MISPSETRSLNNTKHNSYVGIPVYDEDATLKAGNGRFMKNGYQDVWASVLFMIGTLGLLVGALVFFIMSREVKNLDFQFDPSLEINFHSFLITLVASSIGTVMFVTVCMLLMRYFPREYLITSNISIILIFIVTAILTYVYGHKQAIPIMVVLLVVALLHAIWFCFAWKRIPLASLLLAFSNRLVFRYNATVLVSILGFFLNLLYLCAGVLCLAAVLALNDASRQSGSQSSALDHDDDGGNTSPLVIFLITLVVLMWYWGSNVIMNVVHVTVAGVAATVYFLGTCVPSNPTWKSFVRATTTSFGSICLGSLVVAILQLIRYTVRSLMHHRNHVLSICLDCFLGLLENLMEWFNTYAFTYLAIYGESYLNSSKKAWKLIKNAPFGVIFNESLVDNAVLVTALLCTIMANGIVYVSTKSWNLALIASLWTLIISILHLRVITSNVISLFVCVADAPDALQYSEPELHTQINLALQR